MMAGLNLARASVVGAAALALALGVAVPLQAQSSAAAGDASQELVDARAIVDLTQGEKTVGFMLDGLAPVMAQAVLGQLSNDPSLAALMDKIDAQYQGGREGFVTDFSQKFRVDFVKRYPEMAEESAAIYARELDAATLRQVRDFYESAAGRALVASQPKVQVLLSKIGEKIGQDVAIATMTAMISEIENRPAAKKAPK